MSDKFIHKLFATPVFQFKVKDHEKLNSNLSKYIYDLYENDKDGIQRSNVNGWHSKNFKVDRHGVTPDSTKHNWTKINVKVPGYKINKNFIWGATAMILKEFKHILILSAD